MIKNKKISKVSLILLSVLSLLILLLPIKQVSAIGDANSTYTGSGARNFMTEGRIFRPEQDWNKKIGWTDNESNIHYTTFGDYVSTVLPQYSRETVDVAGIKSVDWSLFLIDVNASNDNGFPILYPSNGLPKDISYWMPANATSRERYEISQLYKNLESILNEDGTSQMDASFLTTYMFPGMMGSKKIPNNKDNVPTCRPGMVCGCNVGTGPKYVKVKTEDVGIKTVSGVYSVYAKVIPVKPSNFSKLSKLQQDEWLRTHQAQTTQPIKTAFGKYLDDNRDTLRELRELGKSGDIGENSNYRKSWENFLRGAEQAAKQPLPNIEVALTPENKEGMSKGGTMTYVEMHKEASVSATHTQDKYDEYGCITKTRHSYYIDENGNKQDFTYKETVYGKIGSNKIIDGQYTKQPVRPITSSDYRPAISYQTITVRCNEEEFQKLMNSVGGTVLQQGKASSSAKSKVVKNQVATFYNNLSVDFFYSGKSCDNIWGCTVEPNNAANNDSANNKGKTGLLIDNSFGGQSDGKTGSKFVMFRDNVSRAIRNDVAWLKPINQTPEAILDSKEPAKATYVILDKNGTPNADLFAFEDKDKTTLISGNELQTKWYTVFKSQENVFHWRGSWASENEHPHKMNIQYAYRPTIKSTITDIYNRDGGVEKEMTSIIDVICPTKFNTETTYDPHIINQPKPINYDTPMKEFSNKENDYLKVSFVKSSSESQ